MIPCGSMQGKTIKVGTVSLTVYPWRHPSGRDYWRWAWYDTNGKRRYGTRSTKPDAILAARAKALEIHNGTLDLSEMTPEKRSLVAAFLALDPTWSHIETLRGIAARKSVTLAAGVAEFLELKAANQGRSPRNLITLRKNLTPLVAQYGSVQLDQISVTDLDSYLTNRGGGSRTRQNHRASIVTFFRWCRARDYLPDQTTEAEKMAKPIAERKVPLTYTPEEMQILLDAVQSHYLPWLVLAGFAGIRNEEMHPVPTSRKSPLLWSDIDLERGLITIRPETSKTGQRRVIEMQPNLIAWLEEVDPKLEEVGHHKPPDKTRHGEDAETKRLGKLVGGWRRNALRDSFISYRAAQVGIARAALEAGNSESEAKKSYHDAKSQEEAGAWFSLKPKNI